MWNYIEFAIGLFLILISVVGVFSLYSGSLEKIGSDIVENGVNTEGVIEEVNVTYWAARKGKLGVGGRQYTMAYSFMTLEGETYSSEIEITKEQANSASKGQKITVRYHARQPSINSALGFKAYMTQSEAENVPYGMIIFIYLLFFCGGAWLTWSNWRRIRPVGAPVSAAARMAATHVQPAAGEAGTARSGGFGRR